MMLAISNVRKNNTHFSKTIDDQTQIKTYAYKKIINVTRCCGMCL